MTVQEKIKTHTDVINYFKEFHFIAHTLKNPKSNV